MFLSVGKSCLNIQSDLDASPVCEQIYQEPRKLFWVLRMQQWQNKAHT